MRNEMQRLKMLSELLDQTDDPTDRDLIQEEIWEVEALMELYEDAEYEANHHSRTKYFDI